MRRIPPLVIASLYALISGLWILFSDQLVESLTSDPALLSHLQTAKGWFFVAATAVGLYLLLKSGEKSPTIPESHVRPARHLVGKAWHYLLVFLLLATGIGATGHLFIENQKSQLKSAREAEILAVASLKVNEIFRWREELLTDGRVITETPFIAEKVKAPELNPGSRSLRDELAVWMRSLQKNYHYESIVLADPEGRSGGMRHYIN